MQRTLIVYESKYGATEQIAKIFAKIIKEHEKRVRIF
jgi:flavodoxin